MTATMFEYRALRPDGSGTGGTLRADSRERAVAELHDRGWFPVAVRPASGRARDRRAMPLAELALGLRVLGNLLESGLSVSRALVAFGALAPPSWAVGIEPMRSAVREGKSFALALAAAPLGVPPLVIGMLHAGEAGDGLARAVGHAADAMERAARTRAAVRGALAYPAVLCVAGAASLALLVGVVLPRFAELLGASNQALPYTTRVVLGVAGVARSAAPGGVFVLACAAALWRRWVATEHGRERWHALLLRVPFVGPIRRRGASARVGAAMASLLNSGVSAATALAYAAEAAGDSAVASRVTYARELVAQGERMSRAMARADALSVTTIRLIRAGEESGRLAHMLAHAAAIEQDHAERAVRGAVRLLEPGLILAFGGVVAFVASALLQAMYSIRPGG